ncbi:uncharacterized protein FIBRA_04069 [Fibroporia radiculosa]|uniref:Uncharacterized protein n=1 Tax=Fibroporia radiculosa TaxID=599839 RepID=J4GNW7_9APHY|nr:uncharacterized protein FIBRA_04069 [Fibroporia radiculosa]CCM01995.1 predicted protein [Fibroporia radiculosa]
MWDSGGARTGIFETQEKEDAYLLKMKDVGYTTKDWFDIFDGEGKHSEVGNIEYAGVQWADRLDYAHFCVPPNDEKGRNAIKKLKFLSIEDRGGSEYCCRLLEDDINKCVIQRLQ